VAGDARRAAVIGCGIAGLTAARELQERGFEVCIYAQSLPPDTTSNRSVASFTPTFGLASPERLTPDWVQQFRRAARISWARHQRMVGPRYGVSFINEYRLVDLPPAPSASDPWDPLAQLLPSDVAQTPVLLGPGEHPFGSP
jgi:cation diffusion facilitator CzcD-associated flavoprotein CzcO